MAPSPNVVLVHGLGMSSEYFDRFARALAGRGYTPAAPDLPGFGNSSNAPAGGPDEHAAFLAEWADAHAIRDAIWIGHSLGCNAAAHVARRRPDLVRHLVCIGPLWSDRNPSRLFPLLLADAFREQLSLFIYVFRAYWRCGPRRWFATLWRYRADLRSAPPRVLMLAGERDPLPDRRWIKNLILVPGAHACHFTYPEETASAVVKESFDGVSRDENDQRDHHRDDGNDPLAGAARNAK